MADNEQFAADLKKKFCEGQTPQQIEPAIYDTLPAVAQNYITNNGSQWLAAGCEQGE